MEPEAAISRFASPLDKGHALLVLMTHATAEATKRVSKRPSESYLESIDIARIHACTGGHLVVLQHVVKSLHKMHELPTIKDAKATVVPYGSIARICNSSVLAVRKLLSKGSDHLKLL